MPRLKGEPTPAENGGELGYDNDKFQVLLIDPPARLYHARGQLLNFAGIGLAASPKTN